jgi:hypothetical protein
MRPFYVLEHGRKLAVGQRIQLSGGYDGAASKWLGGASVLTGTVAGFINNAGSPPSMLATLDAAHTVNGVSGSRVLLRLRFARAEWRQHEVVHVVLLPDGVEPQPEAGLHVESHASYSVVDAA